MGFCSANWNFSNPRLIDGQRLGAPSLPAKFGKPLLQPFLQSFDCETGHWLHQLFDYPNMPEYIWHAKRLIISIHIADIALTWLWIICVRSLCCNLYVIDDYMENEWKWYTLMYGYRHPAYYTYICIVQTVHGSISTCMCCIPMHRPGPSRCSCHAMQLGCSHHTLALLHHGPLKHPQTPRHMGLPEKHQQKKGAESQESSRNTTWTDKTMGLLWFTVSSLLCVLSEDQNIHMAITNDIWQQPVWTLW